MVASRFKLLLPLALFALSFALTPYLGWSVASLWTYVGVAAAMSMVRMRLLVALVVALAVLSALFEYRDGARGNDLITIPLVICSISLMMGAFGRQIQAIQQLRKTQSELSRLAVEQERGRVARDLHDILGHSLTVITVKAELAGRLVEDDPARATREIADVEDLARGALVDVRATVAGFRGVSIASELANARSALEAAGIRATIPGTSDEVPSYLREMFGWAVREGVTNVVRHSGATTASVRIGLDFVEVTDNGCGPPERLQSGTGLDGLRERAEASGAVVSIGSSDAGGFRLRVSNTAGDRR
jgi:two-component system sensor histidine kinase DesK